MPNNRVSVSSLRLQASRRGCKAEKLNVRRWWEHHVLLTTTAWWPLPPTVTTWAPSARYYKSKDSVASARRRDGEATCHCGRYITAEVHDSSYSLDDHNGPPSVARTSERFHSRNHLADYETDLGTDFDISRTVLQRHCPAHGFASGIIRTSQDQCRSVNDISANESLHCHCGLEK